MKIIIFVVLFMVLIFSDFLINRNKLVEKNHCIIMRAIFNYRIACIYSRDLPLVDYEDMESYNRTFWRLLDFGYEHILSGEKFKIVEPYIKKEGEEKWDERKDGEQNDTTD